MHFDTEEGVLYSECQVVHPLVSSVLYLSGAHVAGPTVVLDQKYGATHPAPSAQVSHPADGHRDARALMCRGGAPDAKSVLRVPARLAVDDAGENGAVRRSPPCVEPPRPQRPRPWPHLGARSSARSMGIANCNAQAPLRGPHHT